MLVHMPLIMDMAMVTDMDMVTATDMVMVMDMDTHPTDLLVHNTAMYTLISITKEVITQVIM